VVVVVVGGIVVIVDINSTQLNSTQHIFITQTGIDTAIELKSHLRKTKQVRTTIRMI
jgi:hypothetical protein